MRVELSIKDNYLSNQGDSSWGFQEGVRELLQNGKDAETEFSAPLTVRCRAGKDVASSVLIIENDGCTLPYEALLLGHTSKSERSDLIGKFGEGFKLGILALIRNGHSVKIRNGSEVWEPLIVWSEKFSARVLAFDISKGRKEENRIAIEVGGITEETYRDVVAPRFLWLQKGYENVEKVATIYGALLLGPRFKGQIFVKGILVETKSSLSFGYDFSDADLDRDRRMIQSYDFQYKTRMVWQYALAARPDLFKSFSTLVEAESEETKAIDVYAASRLPAEYLQAAANDFAVLHGPNAVPVTMLGECRELEHFGKTGVIVAHAMKAILEQKMGSLESVQENLKTEAKRVYSWEELDEAQRTNLVRAVCLVPGADLDQIQVVDFRSSALRGTYEESGIKLSAAILQDRAQCLATLVHEVAHREGLDGEKSHVARIEAIWSGIVEKLTQG